MLVTAVKPSSTTNKDYRMSIEELLMRQIYPEKYSNLATHSKNFFRTITFDVEETQPTTQILMDIRHKLIPLLDTPYTKEYMTFMIPKSSGGTRQIEAPATELKNLQRSVADTLIRNLRILAHDAAYAYTTGRCAYDALVTHQHNNARWFLKIDLKDFFPSTTAEILMSNLRDIYPLTEVPESSLINLVNLAVNDHSVLPQGSPLSPLLSNLVLLRFDKILSHRLAHFNRSTYTYTRYADDILISMPYDFKYKEVVDEVEKVLAECNLPYEINKSKLRYGSMAGRNWNLGLMYNKDQQITIGNKKKKILHSLVHSFMIDYKRNVLWSVSDTQELVGKLAYLQNVEPEYHENLIRKYENKLGVNLRSAFKVCLNQ